MERLVVNILLSLPLVGAYAINAIGIVVVYRASKVLNLAHGAMTMVAAYAAFEFVDSGLPRGVGILGGLVVSVVLGLLVERLFVRRLRVAGATAQTIGTVAAFGVMVAVAARIWGTTPRQSVPVFPENFFHVGKSIISHGQVGLFLSMLIIAGGLFVLLQRTYLGLVLRGTAENRLAASLMGADPDRMTEFAWGLGGLLAGVAGIMLAAVGSLHPYNLALAALPAYVAALLGGMESLPGAVIGAAVVGLIQGLAPLVGPLEGIDGNAQLIIAVLALVIMARRGARLSLADVAGPSLEVGDTSTRPGRSRAWVLPGVALLLLAPHVVSFSLLGNLNTAAIYVIVATSLVLLTGWVGQISLAHATFVGIGGFVTGIVANDLGLPFPVNLPFAIAAAGLAAAALGVVALRVRGLYLAVATMIFAWMGDRFLFQQPWLTSEAGIFPEPIGRNPGFLTLDLTDRLHFYYVVWAVALLVIFISANLRDTKIGRAFFAVKGSEVAAASLGIDVTRVKLLAFVLSGSIAGAAGGLFMLQQRSLATDQFGISASLFFLAVLVVGGVQSLGGTLAAGLLFGGINELFFRVEWLNPYFELASALLLALVLLAYRRGLAGVPDSLRALRARVPGLEAALLRVSAGAGDFLAQARSGLRRSRDDEIEDDGADEPVAIIAGEDAPVGTQADLPPDRRRRTPLLEAEHITVRFGGLTAADDVSLTVYEGEIVGLIGPNGAGKTTTFNAIAGLNQPTEGQVRLFGEDVTNLPVHQRAARGVGRTFQLIQLFPQLTVFENLLVATHLANPSGVFSGLIAGSRCLLAEDAARRRVREVVDLLDMGEIADRQVAGLPFGVLRMVEVGRALVTSPRLIMLDEPASGLDNAETDRLARLLLEVRDLGVGLLLIEHDVRMVTSVSDYMYVIDQGTPLAEGVPAKVQRNPAVIAAYLGQSGDDTGDGPAKRRRRAIKQPAEAPS